MRYTIPGYLVEERPIFSGEHSFILKGISIEDRTPIAIKILKAEYLSHDELARFKHEYEIIKNLNAPSIVRAYGFKKHQNRDLLILEYIPFPSLSDVLLRYKKFPLELFLEIAIQIVEALGIIHQNHVIHKDINPSNIMCDVENQRIKIIDFGLSVTLPRQKALIASPKMLEGTLPYLSPEQTGRMNRGIDYRTDYYSMGVTFYEMLTGRLPFSFRDPIEIVHFHIAVVPDPPHLIDPSIPEVVSAIIMKLLAKTAEDRYQSTYGLLNDLKTCLNQLKATRSVPLFPLASHDVFNHFQISEKLYGRENEIHTLMNVYDRAVKGSVELMLVAGYSGIGKSALINEIQKPIIEKKGYFVSGKFDQFKHHIPYEVLVKAFSELINQILTESEEKILAFKEKILEAVGENGQIIIDVVPNLISIIGKQPSIPELESVENQHRFTYVFQNFIRAMASKEHPLVIFLDDLQWADSPSMKLIETLMTSPHCQYLFIIGAYRDNEVSSAHPLMVMVDEFKKRQLKCELIEVQPLKIEHVNQLIADTLHHHEESVFPLVEICYDKTQGNPFFLIQLLQTLYKEQLIQFDSSSNQWRWDLAKIQEKDITDNVVEFMIAKIQRFSGQSQKILQLAACVGNHFTLDILMNISDFKTEEKIREVIAEPLHEGLIVSQGEYYRAFSYWFAHDRIQQASYALLKDEQEKKWIHVNIARLLLKENQTEHLHDVLFDVVNHYNIAMDSTIPDFLSVDERIEIAQLNLKAAKLARTAAAFEPSLKYIEYGLKCLDSKIWESNYDLMLELYIEGTEAAYLNAKFDLMDQYAKEALSHVRDMLEEVKIIKTQILAYIVQNNSPAAIDTAITTIARLGINLIRYPKTIHILVEAAKVKFLLIGKSIPDLLNLPEMTNQNIKAAIELMTMILGAAYMARPLLHPILATTIVKLSLRYGNTQLSSNGYAWFGLLMTGILGNIDEGYQFGRLALKLIEKMHEEKTKTKIVSTYCTCIAHWKNPVHELIPVLMNNFQTGLDNGDLEYACYTVLFGMYYSFFSGLSLKETLLNLQKYQLFFKDIGHETAINFDSLLQQTILNFTEIYDYPGCLLGSAYNEVEMEKVISKSNSRVMFAWTYLYKLILSYYFEDYEEALKSSQLCQTYLDGITANFGVPTFYYYQTLLLLNLYPSRPWQEQYQMERTIRSNHKKLKKWAGYAPSNHLHRLLLVEAEWARVQHQISKAIDLYDRAIAVAKQNAFLNDEALANELVAKLYLELRKEKIAKVYMKDAHYCYQLWGAYAKVIRLEQQYPFLELSSSDSSFDSIKLSASTSTSISTTSNIFDLASIQKASQAISSTIVMADLLKKLMHITIESAGAQKGFILLENQEGNYVIEAEKTARDEEVETLKSIKPTEQMIPLSIINYVIHAKEVVVLDDAVRSVRYMQDPYVGSNQLKSVLCMPILNQGKLLGILYLENNLIEGAFTRDRILILELLSSQIAISIDNAKFYAELENKVAERTKELSRKNEKLEEAMNHLTRVQGQLVQQEKLATLGLLSSGVAHELRNPLNFVINFSELINDFVKSRMEETKNQSSTVASKEQEFLDNLALYTNKIYSHGKRAEGIIHRLLSHSYQGASKQEIANIGKLLDTAQQLSQESFRKKAPTFEPMIIKSYTFDETNTLKIFAADLMRVFINIIDNAYYALYEKYQLEGESFIPTLEIKIEDEPSELHIIFKDNGIGILPENRNKLFQPFFTTKPMGEGVGLGLSISQDIVCQKHKGKVEVNTQEREYTEFKIILPKQECKTTDER